ncbi:hypothetical protein [Prosthecobacter dejongeii]|uniref:Tetratricopeptide repeat-containing protein n=1 Tax=Prosthecobacter dejongeii TaxID=48465 RepID=A0A7W7YH26_9BACT|nr:hypothetical protein [Prosthecobacter dejongeii]MBB5035877.1 hypothetical protein [Prosthecobacter dejongeii]
MSEISEFDIPGSQVGVKLPATAADAALEATFKDHPFWKKMRLHAAKMEVLDESGAPFATNEGFAFYPRGLGVKLPEKGVGFVVLSRQRAGGWYLGGRHLGTGVRTQVAGVFRPFLRSKLTDFALRSAHFTRSLLLAKQESMADAQEQYALYNVGNIYGEVSEQVTYACNEIGKLRGYALSFNRAADWHAQAYTTVKTHFGQDKAKLLEIGTDLAESQAEKGDFAAAKATLAEVFPYLPSEGGDARIPYAFYKALGAAEFGLRNYPQAAKLFVNNQKRAEAADFKGYVIESLLDLAACQMALNQPIEAAASVALAMQRQDDWAKKNPKYNFDTYKLSLACVALQKWNEAVKYSSLSQRRNSVSYEEYARLLSLLNRGDKTAAQKMALDFKRRFAGGLDDIQIRRDIDAMTVKLTEAVSVLTPAATADLEQAWAQQVESLRKRPLQNYIFARVMVAAIASLKNGN